MIRRTQAACSLSVVPLFAGLGTAELLEVHALAHRCRLTAGTELFREGSPALALYVLVAGTMRVTRCGPGGQQIVLRIAHPGDILGCALLAGRRTWPGTGEVLSDGVALSFDEKALGTLVTRFPVVSRNAIHVLAGRMEELRVRLHELATDRVDQRLARTLLRLVASDGKPAEGGTRVNLRLSRQDLAELVGSTQFTVSRTLSAWEHKKWVEAGRQWVVVKDSDALSRIADGGQEPSRIRRGAPMKVLSPLISGTSTRT